MNNNIFSLPDDHLSPSSLPPLPRAGEHGPHVCAIIQLYLGILDELPLAQQAVVEEHLHNCLHCAAVQRQMHYTTRLFAGLPASTPSARVDQAILAAIAARTNGKTASHPHPPGYEAGHEHQDRSYISGRTRQNAGTSLVLAVREVTSRKRQLALATALTLVATLLFALLATFHFIGSSATHAFLPANLSWSGYVLYHSETRLSSQGQRYRVATFHDLDTDRIHVETMMPNTLDVVAVGNNDEMLGLDMMHHVAQWGARAWSVDESMFDLTQLRNDMASNRASYLDEDTFHGQQVYRIRCRGGLVLLLNMNYQPVNVLRGAVGPGTGEPVYDTLQLMPASHFSSSMWDMSVPNGFRMGTLPPKP